MNLIFKQPQKDYRKKHQPIDGYKYLHTEYYVNLSPI